MEAAGKVFGKQTKTFEGFFEAQMEAIGLSEEQLRVQGLFELRDGLETVNMVGGFALRRCSRTTVSAQPCTGPANPLQVTKVAFWI